MKKNFFLLIVTVILFFSSGLFSLLQAQEALLSTSKNAYGSNGSITYSVGQTAYISQSGFSGIIMEGVQQPYEIQFLPGIEEKSKREIQCSVFPNPTSGEVTLKIEQWNPVRYRYRLTDLRGELLEEQPVENSNQLVPMESHPPGTYILAILENNILLATYKIIKR